ncbi:MAG: glycosyltransferase family 8 protein [Selenomonadaceae bacterium]|nr:glycosyltransferase family 8 protein [Selenomonadaceae bacterium]
MIHVCLCFRDKTGRYAKFAATTMLSIFENTRSKVTVHIVHDNTLTPDNRDRFFYLAGRYGQFVSFYNLDELCPEKLARIIEFVPDVDKSRVTVGAFYKLLIPQVLPKNIDKVIFLDPDVLVNLDLSELWQTELDDKAMGVVTEAANGTNSDKAFLLCSEEMVKAEDYFNSGVLLMNLNVLRDEEETIMQGIKFRGDNPKQKFLDQTVLNYCFSTRTLKLPLKFNRFVRNERRDKLSPGKKIYHFVGFASKIGMEMDDPFNKLWMNSFIKTPFFDEETIGRLQASFQKIHNHSREAALNIATTMQGKARAFFVESENKASTVKFFSIQKHEEVILAKSARSIKELIEAMKTANGTAVFFIMTEKFLKKKFPFERLTEAGFVEGKDFVKGWTFLSEAQGVAVDSYPLIHVL